LIERFGYEAVCGASGTTYLPDGSIQSWDREGMSAADIAKAKVVLKAEGDVNRSRAKKAEQERKGAGKR